MPAIRESLRLPAADHTCAKPLCRVYVGDCREWMAKLPGGAFDLIFADPPFNWKRDYDRHETGHAWDDARPDDEYLDFTYTWLDLAAERLADHGSLWVNIPDTWAAEIVVHMKRARGMHLVNWCIWHYRFGQNTRSRFINSKVHALYFMKNPDHPDRRWNPDVIAEVSDRRAIYGDPRTETKKEGWMDPGHRVPMDVWYGPYWGRIQGNNKERRHKHDNQLPEVYLGRVIGACSNEGDLVLDPFLGSGTTGTVARHLGRRFVGIEYSKANAEHAWDRIVNKGPYRADALDNQRGVSTAIHPNRRRHKAPEESD
jgi:site-specific DNA-methyltransferase (adenine-specific)